MKLHPSPTTRDPADVDRWIRHIRSIKSFRELTDEQCKCFMNDWHVVAKLMAPLIWMAEKHKPKFESSPPFDTEQQAWDWLREGLLK